MTGTTVSIARLHRAIDIANSIVSSSLPKRVAMMVPTNDILDLACAVVALAQLGTYGAGYVLAQGAALDLTEQPLDTLERYAASEAADAEVDAAHTSLIEALAAFGYLIIKTPEAQDGNAV